MMLNSSIFDMAALVPAPVVPGIVPVISAGGTAPDFALALADLLGGAAPAALSAPVMAIRPDLAVTGRKLPIDALPVPLVAPLPETQLPSDDPAAGVVIEDAPSVRPGDDAETDIEAPDDAPIDPVLAWLVLPTPVPAQPVRPALPLPVTRPALPAGSDIVSADPKRVADPQTADARLPDAQAGARNGAAPMPFQGPAGPVDHQEPRQVAAPPPSGASVASTASPGEIVERAPGKAADPTVGEPIERPIAWRQSSETRQNPAVGSRSRAVDLQPREADAAARIPVEISQPAVVERRPAQLAAAVAAAALPLRETLSGPIPADPALAQVTGAAPLRGAVAPAGDAQQAGIDLTRDPGMHRMIDRIEQLRDAATSSENWVRDTRIRLIPDALGPVDVSVRREGEAVHVHFTTAEPATRQLIADAQPRLTELAESRGVRIERSTVDGGAAGDSQARPDAQQDQRPGRPASAFSMKGGADADAPTDHRIA